MFAKRSQQIVIDASIARAAGPIGATHPLSAGCRDFLIATLDACHHAAFTADLLQEWKTHRSVFALSWRRTMFAKKMVKILLGTDNTELRQQLVKSSTSENDQNAMLKDAHLIEGAIASGMRVASLDDTVRRHFKDASTSVGLLRTICWVNPRHPCEDTISWLHAGAPLETHRTLAAYSCED